MAYRLFLGNINDYETTVDYTTDMKRDFGLKHVIAAADKGLNTSTNIATYVDRDSFVYSQSIRGAKSNRGLHQWVIPDAGYDVRESSELNSSHAKGPRQ